MLFKIPSLLLKQLYTFSSLENTSRGVRLALKNRLSDATVTGIRRVAVDGVEVPVDRIRIELPDGSSWASGRW